ncbi:MAG: glycogen/starch/alpha-glucan phosphorylase [Pseudomonadota bacterium]
MNVHIPAPAASSGDLRAAIESHLTYTVGKDTRAATLSDWRFALTAAIRDQVVTPWFQTTREVYGNDSKRIYYLSMEFLIGRLLQDAVTNLGLEELVAEALIALDQDPDAIYGDEPDAALGNGGLGRLAACFLDSMSTVGIPAYGYGIRYEHGLFRQHFNQGWQVEEAEDWLRQSHPWEFERREVQQQIRFGGHVTHDNGRAQWHHQDAVLAQAYDTPIPGWRARWTNTLRLWSAKPVHVFDLAAFNQGDYLRAAEPAILAETISRVLYPDDTTERGKELRLKQEYFFTAASVQDILRRFTQHHSIIGQLPDKVAIQLNDTHPAIAVAEMLRLLMDRHGLDFEAAFGLTSKTLNYTNHTLLPEALERWPYHLMKRVLPRHLELIHLVDDLHARQFPDRPDGTRIIDHGEVRMGNLAFIAANKVNGVSALHTDLMRATVFSDLNAMYPKRIVNQTNGVTQRRWLSTCNAPLSRLITQTIGDGWVTDLDQLARLEPLADDADFRARFMEAKRQNKEKLAGHLAATQGINIDPGAMLDVQIKRLHEYKRQLMNILETAALWNAIRRDPDRDWPSRVKIFGGKAAPGYTRAKLIIKLINDVAAVVNADPLMRDRLRVVFLPNYNVSQAEQLIPAADLSEQISTAGMEASGTGNMKFALNGALTIGTLDGANVEIREAVGPDNIFIFGLTAEEVAAARAAGASPAAAVAQSPALAEVLSQLDTGIFSPDDPGRFGPIAHDLRTSDWFMVAADFQSCYDAQRKADGVWHDTDNWARMAVLNTARMGRFSSDRTIRGYAADIWGITPAF